MSDTATARDDLRIPLDLARNALGEPIAQLVDEYGAEPLVCTACHRSFDPTDDRHSGRAQYRDTPWCRGCVDRCHDSESADHRCRICFTDPFTQEG